MGWFYLVSAALLLVVSLGCVVRMIPSGPDWSVYAMMLHFGSPAIALGGFLLWLGWRRVDAQGAARVSAFVGPRLAVWLVLALGIALLVYGIGQAMLSQGRDYGGLIVLLSLPGLVTGFVLVAAATRSLWRRP
jgi:hypothetical protein